LATTATIDPTAKSRSESNTRYLRPKVWDIDPNVSWNTVLVSKKDVPAQKASIAELLRSWDMICDMY
jgi:hypothetical protein